MTDAASTPQIFPRFAGKTVLVTGAGTGFGAEIAVRAAQEGAKVAVHYRSSKAGAEADARAHPRGRQRRHPRAGRHRLVGRDQAHGR